MAVRLYGGRGVMARELFVSLLNEHGPLTNRELADLAQHEANLFLFAWSIYPHMVALERAGRVERIQVARNHRILWAVPSKPRASVR